jgi:hypothetical protein
MKQEKNKYPDSKPATPKQVEDYYRKKEEESLSEKIITDDDYFDKGYYLLNVEDVKESIKEFLDELKGKTWVFCEDEDGEDGFNRIINSLSKKHFGEELVG